MKLGYLVDKSPVAYTVYPLLEIKNFRLTYAKNPIKGFGFQTVHNSYKTVNNEYYKASYFILVIGNINLTLRFKKQGSEESN